MPADRNMIGDRIEVENIMSPGKVHRVDRATYEAMRAALLAVLPKSPPALTVAEAMAAVLPLLPDALFPGGDKAGWWQKAAQLDLEVKAIITRENTKTLRLHTGQ